MNYRAKSATCNVTYNVKVRPSEQTFLLVNGETGKETPLGGGWVVGCSSL